MPDPAVVSFAAGSMAVRFRVLSLISLNLVPSSHNCLVPDQAIAVGPGAVHSILGPWFDGMLPLRKDLPAYRQRCHRRLVVLKACCYSCWRSLDVDTACGSHVLKLLYCSVFFCHDGG